MISVIYPTGVRVDFEEANHIVNEVDNGLFKLLNDRETPKKWIATIPFSSGAMLVDRRAAFTLKK